MPRRSARALAERVAASAADGDPVACARRHRDRPGSGSRARYPRAVCRAAGRHADAAPRLHADAGRSRPRRRGRDHDRRLDARDDRRRDGGGRARARRRGDHRSRHGSGGASAFPSFSLVQMDVPTYQPESCPLCANGIPVVKPGSRALASRTTVDAQSRKSSCSTTGRTTSAGSARTRARRSRDCSKTRWRRSKEAASRSTAPAAPMPASMRSPRWRRRPRGLDRAAGARPRVERRAARRTSACCRSRKSNRGFHARFSAVGKVYEYRIVNAPIVSPFLYRYAWHVPQPLDVERDAEASARLIGRARFRRLPGVRRRRAIDRAHRADDRMGGRRRLRDRRW